MATLTQIQSNALNSLKGNAWSFNANIATDSKSSVTSVHVTDINAKANIAGYIGECVSFVKQARSELPQGFWGGAKGGATTASKAGFHIDETPMVGAAFVVQPKGLIATGTADAVNGHTGIVTAVSVEKSANGGYQYVVAYKDYNGLGTHQVGTGTIKLDMSTLATDKWQFIWGKNAEYDADRAVIVNSINQLISNKLLASSPSGIDKLVNVFFQLNTAEKYTNFMNLVELYNVETGAVNVDKLAIGEWTNDVLSGAKVGTSNSDRITGDANNNVIMSGAGNDTIDAGNGNDTIRAGSGDDTINGGFGNDTIDGGAGSDTVSYMGTGVKVNNVMVGVTVDLNKTTAQDTKGAGADTLTNIENISGSLFADTLTGNSLNNVLNGRDGNDKLIGGNGQDTLIGGLGKDTINLTETIAATDTVSIATGDSLVTSYDVVSGFKLGAGTTSTIGIDKLDLASITIAANALKVDGANVGTGINAIMSHHIDKGIINFDDINNYTAPVTVTATNLANVINYLQANIAGSNTVGFVANLADGNHTFVFQDGGVNDTLVDLVGVAATSLNTTGLATGAVWII